MEVGAIEVAKVGELRAEVAKHPRVCRLSQSPRVSVIIADVVVAGVTVWATGDADIGKAMYGGM